MNTTQYTEFQNIEIGAYFIDSEGVWHEKISAEGARHFDPRYIKGYADYKFSADDRLRVQPEQEQQPC